MASEAPQTAASPGGTSLRQYVKEHQVEPLLAEALKAACDAGAPDPVTFIGEFMLAKRAATRVPKNGDADGEDNVTVYLRTGAFGIARQRTGWLLFFLFGLLLCANVMREFEHLLAKELELAFFVPLLIGHGGNSGGQTVSTVIRALGSGAATLSDAPRVVFKEAAAGVMQSIVLACVLAPTIHTTMGISIEVTTIVGLTLPCLGLGANALGAALPFFISWMGFDPAVIVGPLMTTSVDSGGLLSYLGIATAYFAFFASARDVPDESAAACRWGLNGCRAIDPTSDVTCKPRGFKCMPTVQ